MNTATKLDPSANPYGTHRPLFFTSQTDLRAHLDGLFGDMTAGEARALCDQVQHEGPGFGPGNDWSLMLDQLDTTLVWTWLDSDRDGDLLPPPAPITMSEPVLYDYATAVAIRNATDEELTESREAALTDGGSGVIDVDGRSCYVLA